MTKKGKRLGSVSLILVAVLMLTVVFNVAFAGGVSDATATLNSNANKNNTFKNVTGEWDLDTLRSQYLNTEKVEQNTNATFNGERWVIVELDGENLYSQFEKNARYSTFAEYCDSFEGKKAKERLEKAQYDFLAKLDRHSINYLFKYSYTTLNNGVAIKINADAFNAIQKMSGVSSVYYSNQYTVPTVAVSNNANVYTTGIYDSSDLDFKGEGMVVAVLDTGLDYTHEAFQTMPNADTMAWNKEYVAQLLQNPELNARGTIDEIYYNDKVPFAYDYADDDTDVYPSYSTHGTHVAGIVAGSSDYQVNKEDPTETFVGVAPNAQLVICKVFTDNLDSDSLGGADDIDILAAVSDCAELGVDVINMSLGSSCGFTDERSDTFLTSVYEKVRQAGISLVVAASNDYSSGFGGGNGTNLTSNPDSATVGAPSTYPAALSVASINGRLSSYIVANDDEEQVAFVTNSSDENGNDYEFIDLLYEIAGKDKSQTLNFKYVTVSGVGRMTNYTGAVRRELNNKEGYDGTIALVKRGDITFAEKVQNAMDNGADACIIYNNLSGTIHMSLGEVDDPIPTCSIGMDAGKKFAERSKGTISVSYEYKAGPFMSDFSSWGPTPNLELKPEITAHGGEIVSAVPGGYDVYSGTSMASPNMAGAIALLRQYLKNTTDLDGVALNARVNQTLMSTATIALNEDGNPYSPRKQGAGLAGIKQAVSTESYITVLDAQGLVRDKTKLELGDDKNKTGVYTLEFVIHNISGKAETYAPLTHVMTETVASDNKTVAEKAYILNGMSNITYYVDGVQQNGNITVGANQSVSVKVEIVLNNDAKAYLNANFANGMYVEGFVSLQAQGDTKVTIGLPYLAFYGDWTDAPLFDYDTYEIAESEADTGVEPEDKLKASAAATRVLGMYYDDKYILELGAFIYNQPDDQVKIYPERDKAAVSIFDTPMNRTIYEVYMVYAGLLRNAAYMDVVITDATTGEVIFSQTKENIGKSHASGGSNVGAPIMIEINPLEWNLNNNTRYNVSMKGQLDYPNGENPNKNTFDFQFTVDYEAPQMLGYKIRYDAYTENKQTKYRIFMDVEVSDNQYVMDVMPCYIKETKTGNVLTLVTEYPLPVYGQKGETSTVTFEVTDLYDDYVKTGNMLIAVEDYAMNQSLYQLNLAYDEGALSYPESVDFVEDSNIVRTEDTAQNADGTTYDIYELSLAPNQAYKLGLSVLPSADLFQNLSWTVSGASVKAKGDEVFATRTGRTTLKLTDGARIYAQINVVVSGQAVEAPILEKITILPVLNGQNYVVSLDTASPTLQLNPNQSVKLRATTSPWYVEDVDFEWSTTNSEIVTVDNAGNITALKKGNAYINVVAVGTRLSKSIRVVVGSDYRIVNYTLYDYYGGEIVEIPDNLNIMYLDEECFQENKTIKKVILPSSLTEVPKEAFKNCTNLEEIVIPSQCIVLHESAFEGCTKLRKIEFEMFEDRDHNVSDTLHGAITIGPKAFKNCVALAEITNQERLTTIYNNAFEGCTSLTAIDLSQLRVTGSYVFKDCIRLSDVQTSADTNIGEYMFSGCTALRQFTYKGSYLKTGAFVGCSALENFTFAPEGDFLGIGAYALAYTNISNITLPNGEYAIGEYAFGGCVNLESVTLSQNTNIIQGNVSPFGGCTKFDEYVANNSQIYSVVDGVLYNKAKTQLVSVPFAATNVVLPSSVTSIGNGAFAGVENVNTDLSNIQSIGTYAFANSNIQSITLPAQMRELPDGIFFGCSKLSTVEGLEHIERVGKQAFFGCRALQGVNLDIATTIENDAFKQSGIKSLTAPNVERIGANAFEASSLVDVELPSLTSVGYRAFASIPTLKTVAVGAITTMDSNVFADSANITSASFAQGTTVIGERAFYAESGSALAIISLPDSVREIGAYAFAFANNIQTINLSGVEKIGNFAFVMSAMVNSDGLIVERLSKLTQVDLSNAQYIGVGAFAYTNIQSANLANAKVVEANAFMDSTLSSVTFGALQRVGEYAFVGTSLTEVELPATLSSRRYEYTWTVYDDKGRVDEVRTRNDLAFGAGAFAAIPTLTQITVAEGSEDFFDIDGVLYSRVENGIVLEQYPAAREVKTYTVADNTVAIADCAFEGVRELVVITLPYTLKTVGSYAFYQSSVSDYTFTSVEAPSLQSTYVDTTGYTADDLMYMLFDVYDTRNALGCTLYYANFYDYVAYITESDMFTIPIAEDFGLTLNIPKNGLGYDNLVWTSFFSTIKRSAKNEADATTHAALQAIENLPTVAQINAVDSLATLTQEGGYAEIVKNARDKYNQITLTEQIAIAQEGYQKLIEIERAIRERKAAFGQPVDIEGLVIASNPIKLRYDEGEHFDKTGLVLKIVYADGSEIDVTDICVFDKDILRQGDNRITVTCEMDGQTFTQTILVNINASSNPNPVEPDPTPVEPAPTEPTDKDNNTVVIAVSVVVPVVVVAVVLAVVLVLLKKKKAGQKPQAEGAKDDAKAQDKQGAEQTEGAQVESDEQQDA